MKRFLVVTTAVLTLLAFVILSQLYSPSTSFQFLHGKKPLVNEHGSSLSVRVFSFPATFKDLCSKASSELTSLGYLDMTDSIVRNERQTFTKLDKDYSTIITIHHRQLSNESTQLHHIYEPVRGWVSVDVSRYGQSKLRRFLTRFLPPTPNPKISRRINY